MVLLYDRLVRKSRDFLGRNKSIYSDTEKFVPKEKENDRNFFLTIDQELGIMSSQRMG